jgi:hypothetical protein
VAHARTTTAHHAAEAVHLRGREGDTEGEVMRRWVWIIGLIAFIYLDIVFLVYTLGNMKFHWTLDGKEHSFSLSGKP